MNKILKKIPTAKILPILFVIVMATFIAVSYTFAGYQATVTGYGETPVSQFGYIVKINDYADADDGTEDSAIAKLSLTTAKPDGSTTVYNVDVNSMVKPDDVQPGMKGYMPVEIDGTKTQVSTVVTVRGYFVNLPEDFAFTDNLGTKLDKFTTTDFTPIAQSNKTLSATDTVTYIEYSYYLSYDQIARWKTAAVGDSKTMSDPFINIGFNWEWVDKEDIAEYDGDLYSEVRVTAKQVYTVNNIPEKAYTVNFVGTEDALVVNDAKTLNILTNNITTSNSVTITPTKDFYLDVNGFGVSTDTYNIVASDAGCTKIVAGTFRRTVDYKAEANRPSITINGGEVASQIVDTNAFTKVSRDFRYTYNNICATNARVETLVDIMNGILNTKPNTRNPFEAVSTVYTNHTGSRLSEYFTSTVTLEGLEELIATFGDDDNYILWDTNSARFVAIIDGVYTKTITTDYILALSPAYATFRFYDETDFTQIPQTKAIYLVKDLVPETADDPINIAITTGIDTGNTTGINKITYNGTTEARDIIIRTSSFSTTLDINGYKNGKLGDVVTHYGYAAIVEIIRVADASYHENGTVGRLAVQEGHVVIEQKATVVCLMDVGDDTTAGKDIATIDIVGESVIHDSTDEEAEQELIDDENNTYVGTTNEGYVADCGAGHHTYGQKIVIDTKHVYDICKCCGYTLITIINDTTQEEITQTKNVVDPVDPTKYIEVVTPIETRNYDNESTKDAVLGNYPIDETVDPVVPTPDVTPEYEQEPEVLVCTHTWNDGDITKASKCTENGTRTYTCTKCGITYDTSVNVLGHDFGDWVTDGVDTTHTHTCQRQNCNVSETKAHTFVDKVCTACGQAHNHTYTETSYNFYSGTLTEDYGYHLKTYTCTYGDTVKESELATDKGVVAKVVKNSVPYYATTLSAASANAGVNSYTATLITNCGDYTQANYKGNWSLDLNGYTLTNTRGVENEVDVIGTTMAPGTIAANGSTEYGWTNTLTIKDTSTSGNGMIYNKGTATYSVAVYIASNCPYNIKIASGTIKSDHYALYAANGTITVNGGTIIGLLGVYDKGKIVINAGKFTDPNAVKYLATGKILVEEDGYFVVKDSTAVPTTYTARVNTMYYTTTGAGNTALNFAKSLAIAEVELKEATTVALSLVEKDDITIIADTSLYTAPVATSGFELKTENVTGGIRYYIPETPAFTLFNGSTKVDDYTSLASAFTTTSGGSIQYVIKLNKDVTVNENLSYSHSSGTGTLTLDLNGHTLTMSAGKKITLQHQKNMVTIKNGTLIGDVNTLISNQNGGTTKGLSLEDLTVTNNSGWILSDSVTTANCPTKTIKNCTLTGTKISINNYVISGNTTITTTNPSNMNGLSNITAASGYTLNISADNKTVVCSPVTPT